MWHSALQTNELHIFDLKEEVWHSAVQTNELHTFDLKEEVWHSTLQTNELHTFDLKEEAWYSAVQYEFTLDIGDKEASGRFLLGMFMNTIRKILSDKYPSICLRVDHI